MSAEHSDTAGIISTGQLITFKGERWIMEGLSREGRERDQTDSGQCGVCRWSGWNIAATHYETKQHTAQCRRFPPLAGRHREWPTVAKLDGCGEWSARHG